MEVLKSVMNTVPLINRSHSLTVIVVKPNNSYNLTCIFNNSFNIKYDTKFQHLYDTFNYFKICYVFIIKILLNRKTE